MIVLRRKQFGVGAFLGKMVGAGNWRAGLNIGQAGNNLTKLQKAGQISKGIMKSGATLAGTGALVGGTMYATSGAKALTGNMGN